MKKFIALLLIVPMMIAGAPRAHAGTSHTYTCADGLSPAGAAPGCTSVGNYNFTGGASSYTDNTPVYTLNPGTTYYLSYTSNAEGGGAPTEAFQFNSTGSVTYIYIHSGTYSEVSSGASGGASAGGLIIRFDIAGIISGVCIDTDGVSCSGGGATFAPWQFWAF